MFILMSITYIFLFNLYHTLKSAKFGICKLVCPTYCPVLGKNICEKQMERYMIKKKIQLATLTHTSKSSYVANEAYCVIYPLISDLRFLYKRQIFQHSAAFYMIDRTWLNYKSIIRHFHFRKIPIINHPSDRP